MFPRCERPKARRARGRTLIGQHVFGIALGYEDLNDHDGLRHDPLMAVWRAGFSLAQRLRAGSGQIDAEPAGTLARHADEVLQDRA